MNVVIIGAGVSGLACARALKKSGRSVLVLERGRNVGGRCSAWRTDDGHLIDYGVTFYHGESDAFIEALRQVNATRIDGWPNRVEGRGSPSQPHSFLPRSNRLAFAEGANVFPTHLARDIDVRCATNVERIEVARKNLLLYLSDGEIVQVDELVLAMPCSQIRKLLGPVETVSDEARGVRHLLSTLHEVPSLAVLASYESSEATPEWGGMWEALLPEDSEILQLVSRESGKRPDAGGGAFVIQARPGWSARHLESSPEDWTRALLDECGKYTGDWIRSPKWTKAHRWRYARTDIGAELASPILLEVGNSRIGLSGETFYRGAGVEAAFLSGVALARRMTE